MPKIRFKELPAPIITHLSQRVRDREISVEDLKRLETWKASDPDAPDGNWYKDFGSFKLCGEGESPKTILTKNMKPYGVELP